MKNFRDPKLVGLRAGGDAALGADAQLGGETLPEADVLPGTGVMGDIPLGVEVRLEVEVRLGAYVLTLGDDLLGADNLLFGGDDAPLRGGVLLERGVIGGRSVSRGLVLTSEAITLNDLAMLKYCSSSASESFADNLGQNRRVSSSSRFLVSSSLVLRIGGTVA